MGAGHSWPRRIATRRGSFSGQMLCSTEPAYQRGFSGATGDRSRRTPNVAPVVLSARFGRNVVPKRFGTFISTSIISTYVFEVLKTSLITSAIGRGGLRKGDCSAWIRVALAWCVAVAVP